MQRIATTNPEVAALPVNLGANEYRDDRSHEAFKNLLREQKQDNERAFQPVEPKPVQTQSRKSQQREEIAAKDSVSADKHSGDNVKERQESVEQQTRTEANKNTGNSEPVQETFVKEQNSDKVLSEKSQDNSDLELTVEADENEVDWLALLNRIEDRASKEVSDEDLQDPSLKIDILNADSEQGVSEQNESDELATSIDGKLFDQEIDTNTISLKTEDVPAEGVLHSLAALLALIENSNDDSVKASKLDELERLVEQLINGVANDEAAAADATDPSVLAQLDASLLSKLLGGVTSDTDNKERQLDLLETLKAIQTDETISVDELVSGDQAQTEIELGEIAQQDTLPQNEIVSTVLESLAKLDGEKLDLALRNLANRLNEMSAQGQTDRQTQLFPADADTKVVNIFHSEESKSQFVASLKAGIEEFKSQLKQGHEPGLDLKALVNESLSKLNNGTPVIEVSTQQLEQTLSTFGQNIEFADRLQNSLSQLHQNIAGIERSVLRDSNQQAQIDQAKHLSQQQSQLDKAINITRPEGHQQLADKVRWMVNQSNVLAEIRLDPPELGSMQVKVHMNGDAANVSFVVQSQQARDVLDQAVPRLKELLEEQGIQLGQSSVQQEQNQAQDAEQQLAGDGQDMAEQEENVETTEQPIINGRIGGIDYFV